MSENRSLQPATATSEEETFSRLKRTSIEVLYQIFIQDWYKFYANEEMFGDWLEKHGWTYDEFFIAGRDYERRIRDIQNT